MNSIKLSLAAMATFGMIACGSPEESDSDSDSQDTGFAIPENVMNTFNERFPDATEAEWWPDGEAYEVAFTKDGLEYEALFDAAGNFVEAETEISVDQLPMLAQDYINENYPDFEIAEIEIEVNQEGSFYEVDLESVGAEVELIFTMDGEFIEADIEEEIKEEIESTEEEAEEEKVA